MKKNFSRTMMFMAACLLAASPVFAHCGHCDMEKAADGTEVKQCPPDCDKPCCAKDKDKKQCSMSDKKEGKVCSLHGKKDCCDKKGHGHAKTNFGPRSRK